MVNEKARRILFDTYWSSAGWKRVWSIAPDDFDYARSAGYMFDPVSLSHDQAIHWLVEARAQVDRKNVVNAFLASLTTRRLDLRSALGSYAVARHFPIHEFTPNHEGICAICGEITPRQQEHDLSILSFERQKWGGVRHLRPLYIAFDLTRLAQEEKLQPLAEDLEVLWNILETASVLAPTARPGDLEKRLGKVIPSNKNERTALIQILAYCGILQPAGHPGFLTEFASHSVRTLPPVSQINWTYPVSWWKGADGVNQQAVDHYFPELAWRTDILGRVRS